MGTKSQRGVLDSREFLVCCRCTTRSNCGVVIHCTNNTNTNESQHWNQTPRDKCQDTPFNPWLDHGIRGPWDLVKHNYGRRFPHGPISLVRAAPVGCGGGGFGLAAATSCRLWSACQGSPVHPAGEMLLGGVAPRCMIDREQVTRNFRSGWFIDLWFIVHCTTN